MRPAAFFRSTTSGKLLSVAVVLISMALLGQLCFEMPAYDGPRFISGFYQTIFSVSSLLSFFLVSRRIAFFPPYQPILQNLTVGLFSIALAIVCFLLSFLIAILRAHALPGS